MQQPGNIFRRSFFRSARSNSSAQSEQQAPSLSQRLRTLSKEYGWSALWVYLILSAVDFPLCFMAVRLAGVERIGHYEHVISESVKGAVRKVWPPSEEEEKAAAALQRQAEQEEKEAGEEKANGGEASKWLMFLYPFALDASVSIRDPLANCFSLSFDRSLDAACPRLCGSQESYLYSGSPDGCDHSQRCQGSEGLGLGYCQG